MVETSDSAGRKQWLVGGSAAAIVAAMAIYYFGYANVSAADAARVQTFVDQTTKQPFKAKVDAGMAIPCKAPSGGMTGYPADLCYWTADGKVRPEPYPLICNERLGQPGPTFCPDCGRLVVPDAAVPQPGDVAPPKAGADFDAYTDDLRKRGLVVNPS